MFKNAAYDSNLSLSENEDSHKNLFHSFYHPDIVDCNGIEFTLKPALKTHCFGPTLFKVLGKLETFYSASTAYSFIPATQIFTNSFWKKCLQQVEFYNVESVPEDQMVEDIFRVKDAAVKVNNFYQTRAPAETSA